MTRTFQTAECPHCHSSYEFSSRYQQTTCGARKCVYAAKREKGAFRGRLPNRPKGQATQETPVAHPELLNAPGPDVCSTCRRKKYTRTDGNGHCLEGCLHCGWEKPFGR